MPITEPAVVLSMAIEECCSCSVVFQVPLSFQRRMRDLGGRFYCPNGHSQSYTNNALSLAQEALAAERSRRDQAEGRAHAAESEAAQLAATLSKTRKRIGVGTCPCCKRHFKALSKHMKCKHPKYREGE
jgi:hypothetical protein